MWDNFLIIPPRHCLYMNMPCMKHTPPNQQSQDSQSSSLNVISNAARHILNFDQQLPLAASIITQPSGLPLVSLRPLNPLRSIFSNAVCNRNAPLHVPPNPAMVPPMNSATPPVSGQILSFPASSDAGMPATPQMPQPVKAATSAIDRNIDNTDSTNSFVNLDSLLAPATTLTTARNHRSSIAIADANEVKNSQLEAHDALEQLNTTAMRITNNAPTVQTLNQIIGAISDQFQAQQLCIQHEIHEQAQATNTQFTALAKQMQQLISTMTTTPAGNNPPTPRPLPRNSWFYCEEPPDIYITKDTFRETELALAYGCPPPRIKLKALSMDTLYNNKFSGTARREDDVPHATLTRHLPPAAHPFSFSDYLLDNYYDHP
uniref:Uncharacterized protein n=1 Tax=Romanomermis culicivorax TaxID=13658 RepID=A0A915HZS2_ROMCU